MQPDETAANARNRLMVLNACGFVVWQLGSFGPGLAGRVATPFVIVLGLAGFAVWIVSLVRLLRATPDPRTRVVLDDELTRHNRQRSVLVGYWLMLTTAAGALALASVMSVPAIHALRAVIVVGVAGPLLRFVYLERSVGGD